jgi:glutamine synthetase
MVLQPDSFYVLPWAENTGWIMGDIYRTDGSPISVTGRHLLRDAIGRLNARGMAFVAGLEVELHVTDLAPRLMTEGFQYLTEDRSDQLTPVFDLILANARGLNLPICTLESEFSPSQCEITFEPRQGLVHADNVVLLRSMVKQVCRRAGYHATFMCAPKYEGTMASGWHLHQSLADRDSGANLFEADDRRPLSAIGAPWAVGRLKRANESCICAVPTVNGYRWFKAHAMVPDRARWSQDHKGAMLRVVNQPPDATRVENRLGEPAANPYLYMLSQIVSGLDGVENSLALPDASTAPYASDGPPLPTNLGASIAALDNSSFFRSAFGNAFVDYYVHPKDRGVESLPSHGVPVGVRRVL